MRGGLIPGPKAKCILKLVSLVGLSCPSFPWDVKRARRLNLNPFLIHGNAIFARTRCKSAKTLRIVFSFFGTEEPQARVSPVARVSERPRRDVLRQRVHACCLGHVPSITTRTVTPHISLDIMEGSATGGAAGVAQPGTGSPMAGRCPIERC